ncbi:hypothetical protein AEA09_01780 [Lysinibacillus contaminans]|uniref:Transposase n=1 Tax=Lysinibacillus contaminans TaxID=1293441 RepID=A0ABR5K5N6_9BACI|nr:hypothetical protein AEA09_01780 [Lysinibacillus contaminans]
MTELCRRGKVKNIFKNNKYRTLMKSGGGKCPVKPGNQHESGKVPNHPKKYLFSLTDERTVQRIWYVAPSTCLRVEGLFMFIQQMYSNIDSVTISYRKPPLQ